MAKIFVEPYEIKEVNLVVFKIIEGNKKNELVSLKLNELDYLFVTELFEEAELDSDIETPILKIDLEKEMIISEEI